MKGLLRDVLTCGEYDHLLHFVGGALVGAWAFTPYGAFYSAVAAASCLELKDWLKGGEWDWADWAFTVGGGTVMTFVYWLIGIIYNS